MLKFSANLACLFKELEFLDRIEAAKSAGFDAIELPHVDKNLLPHIEDRVKKLQIEVSLINCDTGDLEQGGLGLSAIPGRNAQFEIAFNDAFERALRLECGFIHVGPSCAKDKDASLDSHLLAYRNNLTFAAERCKDANITPLIEPISSVILPNVIFSSYRSAAAFLEKSFFGEVGLQFDLYHAAMNATDILKEFKAVRPLVRYVQISDFPGRGEPGSGKLPISELFSEFITMNNAPWIGAEYKPTSSTLESLSWLHFEKKRHAA